MATPTCADRFFDDLAEMGVRYLFVNWGSEHPPLIEALARRRAAGRLWPQPILCPHEVVALSAAQGYAQRTGRPQGVIVHADVGTQNLGGALHNACRSRTPVLIFGGVSPHAVLGEEFGGRNEYQMVLQDVPDQHAIVRQYVKWAYHGRSAAHLPMVTARAYEVAASEPTGPVYLSLAREVLEAPAGDSHRPAAAPAETGGLRPDQVEEIHALLQAADSPVLITSYLGRKPEAVEALVAFSEAYAVPVVESFPHFLNFPAAHRHHLGFHAHVQPEPHLAGADLVLVVDSDFPWLPANENPPSDARVIHIDVDADKRGMPLWHVPRAKSIAADAGTALLQLTARAEGASDARGEQYAARSAEIAREHEQMLEAARETESEHRSRDLPSVESLAGHLRELLSDEDIVLNEAITNSGLVFRHLQRTQPGTLFGSGGSSLGWNGGAALGIKLAAPDRTVVSITGDGSYIFGVPSATHWVAARYGLPVLTIVLNNAGWRAPEMSTRALHAQGDASKGGTFFNEFRPGVDYPALARAAGVKYARSVSRDADLKPALTEALKAVRDGRPALLEIQLEAGAGERV